MAWEQEEFLIWRREVLTVDQMPLDTNWERSGSSWDQLIMWVTGLDIRNKCINNYIWNIVRYEDLVNGCALNEIPGTGAK